MNNLLYVIAVVLLIGWMLGTFVFVVGKIIHVLLVLAIIVIVIRIMRSNKV